MFCLTQKMPRGLECLSFKLTKALDKCRADGSAVKWIILVLNYNRDVVRDLNQIPTYQELSNTLITT